MRDGAAPADNNKPLDTTHQVTQSAADTAKTTVDVEAKTKS